MSDMFDEMLKIYRDTKRVKEKMKSIAQIKVDIPEECKILIKKIESDVTEILRLIKEVKNDEN